VLLAGYHCEWLVKNTISEFDDDTHRQEIELNIFQLVTQFMQECHSINLIGLDLVRLEVCSHTPELLIYFERVVQLHALRGGCGKPYLTHRDAACIHQYVG
jgi:hypothetical protein